ncbi:MAG: transglutaminase-like domain-containing protein [bacterium]
MRTAFLIAALMAVLMAALTIVPGAGFVQAEAPGGFVLSKTENPAFHSNELFPAYEDYYSPRVWKLREQYNLDRLIAEEPDEFRRIMLLRHWVHSSMPIDDYDYTHTRMDPFAILDAARAGGKFNCAQFSVVQHAVLNSFGYVARCLGIGPGRGEKEDLDGHHAVNEVWVNTLNKWVLVDAKYDLHFEKQGIPLSALEIRDAVWQDGAKDVTPCFGLDRKPVVAQINDRDWGIWATPEVYRWCSWETSTNRFTSFPAALSSTLIMYEDDISQKNIWYRDGQPHWAYDTPYLMKTTQRDWIYWTPNVILSAVVIQDGQVRISLLSFTPNFKAFQMKIAEGDWQSCSDSLDLPLQGQTNRFTFRTVNLFGVTGPEHRVEVNWQESEL